MRKMLMMITMLATAMTLMAQNVAVKYIGLEEIEKGWKTKTINNVVNGSLGVMMERFDQTWPTWMVGAVCRTMKKGLTKEVLEDETELTVIADTKNGYAEVRDAGTDGEYMSACIWKRNNGHRLLAICLGDPTDPFIEFVCFYDYNPKKKTLTPEPDVLEFREWTTRHPYYHRLPRYGKNLVIEDWGEDGPLRRIFTWDGMKPVLSKTEPYIFDDELQVSAESLVGEWRWVGKNVPELILVLEAGNDAPNSNGLKVKNLYRYRIENYKDPVFKFDGNTIHIRKDVDENAYIELDLKLKGEDLTGHCMLVGLLEMDFDDDITLRRNYFEYGNNKK